MIMVDKDADEFEKGSPLDGAKFSDIFYENMRDKVKSGDIDSLLGEYVNVHKENGTVYVDCTTKFWADAMKNHYDGNIKEVLSDMGLKSNIKYSVKPETEGVQLSFDSEPLLPDNEKDLVARCSRYDSLGEARYNGLKPILHGGNKEVYAEVEDVLKTLIAGEKQESPLIIRGKNGLGKSHALESLLVNAKEAGIPTVAYNVDWLVSYLRENGGKGCRIEDPEWYNLAMSTPKLIVLDQMHAMVNKANSSFDQRVGTQKRIYNLIENISKRGGHIVLSFTETNSLKFSGLVDLLKGEIKDRWGNYRHADLGDRLANFNSVEITNVPRIEYGEVIREIIGGNKIFSKNGVVDEDIVSAFVLADYGIQSTLRKAVSNVQRIAHKHQLHGYEVTPEFIINTVGSEKAKNYFAAKGFEFKDKPSDRKSLFEVYSVDDISEAIVEHNVMNRISLGDRDSKAIRSIEHRWLAYGGYENPEANRILKLNDGNASVAEVKAMKALLAGYDLFKMQLIKNFQ